MTNPPIVLEAHICDQRRSYKVTFEGPNAEAMAIAFMDARGRTHAIGEWIEFDDAAHVDPNTGDFISYTQVPADEQPHLIDGNVYPQLYARLNPTCEHGMSAWLCYGPAHYVSDDELARGW